MSAACIKRDKTRPVCASCLSPDASGPAQPQLFYQVSAQFKLSGAKQQDISAKRERHFWKEINPAQSEVLQGLSGLVWRLTGGKNIFIYIKFTQCYQQAGPVGTICKKKMWKCFFHWKQGEKNRVCTPLGSIMQIFNSLLPSLGQMKCAQKKPTTHNLRFGSIYWEKGKLQAMLIPNF